MAFASSLLCTNQKKKNVAKHDCLSSISIPESLLKTQFTIDKGIQSLLKVTTYSHREYKGHGFNIF